MSSTSAAMAGSRSAPPICCARSRPNSRRSTTAPPSSSSTARKRITSSAPRRGSSGWANGRRRRGRGRPRGAAAVSSRKASQDDPWAARAGGAAATAAPALAEIHRYKGSRSELAVDDWLDVGALDDIPMRARTVPVLGGKDRRVPHRRRPGLCPVNKPAAGPIEKGRPWRQRRLSLAQLGDLARNRQDRGAGRRLHADHPGPCRQRPGADRPGGHAAARRLTPPLRP